MMIQRSQSFMTQPATPGATPQGLSFYRVQTEPHLERMDEAQQDKSFQVAGTSACQRAGSMMLSELRSGDILIMDTTADHTVLELLTAKVPLIHAAPKPLIDLGTKLVAGLIRNVGRLHCWIEGKYEDTGFVHCMVTTQVEPNADRYQFAHAMFPRAGLFEASSQSLSKLCRRIYVLRPATPEQAEKVTRGARSWVDENKCPLPYPLPLGRKYLRAGFAPFINHEYSIEQAMKENSYYKLHLEAQHPPRSYRNPAKGKSVFCSHFVAALMKAVDPMGWQKVEPANTLPYQLIPAGEQAGMIVKRVADLPG